MLPDGRVAVFAVVFYSLNAPTGAWCSLTVKISEARLNLPERLNAPTGAWCSLTLAQAIGIDLILCLNAPTGAWCSLTNTINQLSKEISASQCTYRCVVLPDVGTLACCAFMLGSQCTYRCVVLPDTRGDLMSPGRLLSQCTYRCVVLPDPLPSGAAV